MTQLQRHYYLKTTSQRRFDALMTLLLRHVSSGIAQMMQRVQYVQGYNTKNFCIVHLNQIAGSFSNSLIDLLHPFDKSLAWARSEWDTNRVRLN